jgi:hypothetical protein
MCEGSNTICEGSVGTLSYALPTKGRSTFSVSKQPAVEGMP